MRSIPTARHAAAADAADGRAGDAQAQLPAEVRLMPAGLMQGNFPMSKRYRYRRIQCTQQTHIVFHAATTGH